MSQIYKSKHQASDQEEEETQRSYVEVSDKKKKKQILQIQLKQGKQVVYQLDGSGVFKEIPKVQQQLIIVENTQSKIQEKVKNENVETKQPKQRRSIKDDRERVKVKQVDRQQKKTENDKNRQQAKNNKNKNNPPKYQNKVPSASEEENDFVNPKKLKYVQKQTKGQEPSRVPKKYVQKNVNKIRRQQQVKNGEKITVEVIQNSKQYDNQIYINRKEINDYVQLAIDLLNKFDYIVLKAFGYYVTKAFQVAGILQQQISSLKQISIPSIIRVKQINRIGQKELNRAFIKIQLSLHQQQLDQTHIGYQASASKTKTKYEQKNNNKQNSTQYKQKYHEDKRQYQNQKGSYKNDKKSNKYEQRGQNNQFKYKQKEIDERQLR